ncbi:MAG: hypothetical protein ACK55Z_05920, partial [bacterium]
NRLWGYFRCEQHNNDRYYFWYNSLRDNFRFQHRHRDNLYRRSPRVRQHHQCGECIRPQLLRGDCRFKHSERFNRLWGYFRCEQHNNDRYYFWYNSLRDNFRFQHRHRDNLYRRSPRVR